MSFTDAAYTKKIKNARCHPSSCDYKTHRTKGSELGVARLKSRDRAVRCEALLLALAVRVKQLWSICTALWTLPGLLQVLARHLRGTTSYAFALINSCNPAWGPTTDAPYYYYLYKNILQDIPIYGVRPVLTCTTLLLGHVLTQLTIICSISGLQ